MMRAILICVAALTLCACKPAGVGRTSGLIPPADAPVNPTEPATAPDSAPAAAPVEAPSLEGALDANGTEPFWSLKIRRDFIVLSRPDETDVVAVNQGVQMQGPQGVWRTTTAAKGEDLTVTMAPAQNSPAQNSKGCSNGMSGKSFPFSATVQLGADTFKGCAGPPQPKPPS